jgi:hypothetical protein
MRIVRIAMLFRILSTIHRYNNTEDVNFAARKRDENTQTYYKKNGFLLSLSRR